MGQLWLQSYGAKPIDGDKSFFRVSPCSTK